MISPLSRFASSNASLLLPAPVGPDITITFSFSFFFLPLTETEQVVLAQNLLRLANDARKGLCRCSCKQHARIPHAPVAIVAPCRCLNCRGEGGYLLLLKIWYVKVIFLLILLSAPPRFSSGLIILQHEIFMQWFSSSAKLVNNFQQWKWEKKKEMKHSD